MAQLPNLGEPAISSAYLLSSLDLAVKLNFFADGKPLLKPSSRWLLSGVIAVALAVSGVTFWYAFRFRQGAATANLAIPLQPRTAVSALGHLQPEGDVIRLSAPLLPNGMGSRVERLLKQEGDWVEAGETVAVLDSFESLQAVVRQAERRVEVAQARLAQVQAGAQAGELAAQRATIAHLQAELQGQLEAQDQRLTRLQVELTHAQTDYARHRDLFERGAVSASQMDSKQLAMVAAEEQWNEARAQRSRVETTLREQINAAQATLSQMAEVRPTDLQAAQAELQSAIADVDKAQADLNLTAIRAPAAGQILEIYARPGELVGSQGVLALGQTQQMNVIAEVYELDVRYVQVGQTATITADALPGALHGEVTQVGFKVNAQNVFSTDPVIDVDRRVVEVKIRIDPTQTPQVTAFTNLQVEVVIDMNS